MGSRISGPRTDFGERISDSPGTADRSFGSLQPYGAVKPKFCEAGRWELARCMGMLVLEQGVTSRLQAFCGNDSDNIAVLSLLGRRLRILLDLMAGPSHRP